MLDVERVENNTRLCQPLYFRPLYLTEATSVSYERVQLSRELDFAFPFQTSQGSLPGCFSGKQRGGVLRPGSWALSNTQTEASDSSNLTFQAKSNGGREK